MFKRLLNWLGLNPKECIIHHSNNIEETVEVRVKHFSGKYYCIEVRTGDFSRWDRVEHWRDSGVEYEVLGRFQTIIGLPHEMEKKAKYFKSLSNLTSFKNEQLVKQENFKVKLEEYKLRIKPYEEKYI